MKRLPIIKNGAIQLGPTMDSYGIRLPLVFGNENKNGSCPFWNKSCTHCDIGAGEGEFTSEMNNKRLAFLRDYFRGSLPNANHILVFNSGSILNEREMSSRTLDMILEQLSSLPNCQVISLDTRETYVTPAKIKQIRSKVRADQDVRINLGIETQNDNIRLDLLKKTGMTRENIESVFRRARDYNLGVDINLVFQPPGVTGREAVEEAERTAQYFLGLKSKYGIHGDINFHPYYPSEKGRNYFQNHPRADLRYAKEAIEKIKRGIDNKKSSTKLYIGWDDEGHDQEPGVRELEMKRDLKRFMEFNKTQNIQDLLN